jgi:flagellar biosynthesis anti-sigma factor FlgM
MKVQGPRGQVAVPDKAQVKSTGDHPVERSPGARVSVSNLSQTLSAAREPEAPDAARVEKLRESIRVGQFRVNHEQTAEAMVAEEL